MIVEIENRGNDDMKAIGYARVSTGDQAESGLSLQHQESKIKAYCEAMDITLSGVLVDAGYSAKSLNRPAMQEALELIKSKSVDAIVILKLDRITRSVKDLGELVELIEKKGVALVSVQDSINTTTAAGRLCLNMLASISQWEREAISERTAAALQVKKASGQRVGTIPFGYNLADDGISLIENSDEQTTLNLIRRLRDRGMSFNRIAADLTRRGIATKKGGKWAAQTVSNLCQGAAV